MHESDDEQSKRVFYSFTIMKAIRNNLTKTTILKMTILSRYTYVYVHIM